MDNQADRRFVDLFGTAGNRRDDEVFADPRRGVDDAPDQRGVRRICCFQYRQRRDVDTTDREAGSVLVDVIGDGGDLGQLRHASSVL